MAVPIIVVALMVVAVAMAAVPCHQLCRCGGLVVAEMEAIVTKAAS